MHRIRIEIVAGLVSSLVIGGATPAAAADEARMGEFRPRECQVDLQTSRHVDCGSIRLPQVRSDPSAGSVRINVAIVRAVNPRPDPILFVMGGPDYPGVDAFSTYYLGGKEFGRHRDWILFDARGTGSSTPRLGCPELDEVEQRLFPDPGPGGFTRVDKLVAAHRACRQRLEDAGVVPRAFASADVALDLRDLRLELGIDKWNVVGMSAGGEATLQLMRLDPEGVRSVILDSPITRNYRPTFDNKEGGYQLMERAFRLCAKQPDCAAAYPNLRNRFMAEVDRLAANPIELEVAVYDGSTVTWTINGGFLLEEAIFFTRDPILAADWPGLADYLARGNVDDYVNEIVLEPPAPFDEVFARGRTHAARCRDAFNFQTDDLLAREQARFPRLAGVFATWFEVDQRTCRAWRVGKSSPAGYGYIDSDLPVLTLRGEWDNVSDDNGHILGQARHFPNGWAYTFPNHGHLQLLDWPNSPAACADSIAADFLTRPSLEPDSSCIAGMPRFAFNTGAAPNLAARPSTVRPLEWDLALRP